MNIFYPKQTLARTRNFEIVNFNYFFKQRAFFTNQVKKPGEKNVNDEADTVIGLPPYTCIESIAKILSKPKSLIAKLLEFRKVDGWLYQLDPDGRLFASRKGSNFLFPYSQAKGIFDTLKIPSIMVDIEPGLPSVLCLEETLAHERYPVIALIGSSKSDYITFIKMLLDNGWNLNSSIPGLKELDKYVESENIAVEKPDSETKTKKYEEINDIWQNKKVFINTQKTNIKKFPKKNVSTFEKVFFSIPNSQEQIDQPLLVTLSGSKPLSLILSPTLVNASVTRGRIIKSASRTIIICKGTTDDSSSWLRKQVYTQKHLSTTDLVYTDINSLIKPRTSLPSTEVSNQSDIYMDQISKSGNYGLGTYNMSNLKKMKRNRNNKATKMRSCQNAVPLYDIKYFLDGLEPQIQNKTIPVENTRSSISYHPALKYSNIPPLFSAVVLDLIYSPTAGNILMLRVESGSLNCGSPVVIGPFAGIISELWINTEPVKNSSSYSVIWAKISRKSQSGISSVTVDDKVYGISLERAQILSKYRRDVEKYSQTQVRGPPLNHVTWELDPYYLMNSGNVAHIPSRFNYIPQLEKEDNTWPIRISSAKRQPFYIGSKEELSFNVESHQNNYHSSDLTKVKQHDIEKSVYTENTNRMDSLEELRRKPQFEQIPSIKDVDPRLDTWEESITHLHNKIYSQYTPPLELKQTKTKTEFHRVKSYAFTKSLPISKPVVPVIFKCQSLSIYHMIYDALEDLSKTLNVNFPIVHSGIGPVNKSDLAHAEAEKHISWAPLVVITLPKVTASKIIDTDSREPKFHDIKLDDVPILEVDSTLEALTYWERVGEIAVKEYAKRNKLYSENVNNKKATKISQKVKEIEALRKSLYTDYIKN